MATDLNVRSDQLSDHGSEATEAKLSSQSENHETETTRREPTNLFSKVERVFLGGIPTARLTRRALADLMVADCLVRRDRRLAPRLVFSSNGQGIAFAGGNPTFAAALDHADLVHADGMSVVLASKFLTDRPLPERVPTTDFFHDAARAGQQKRLRFYLLGGREDVNEKAFELMRRRYPDIQWVGRHHGFFSADDEERICDDIIDARPDVLWLALGAPASGIFRHSQPRTSGRCRLDQDLRWPFRFHRRCQQTRTSLDADDLHGVVLAHDAGATAPHGALPQDQFPGDPLALDLCSKRQLLGAPAGSCNIPALTGPIASAAKRRTSNNAAHGLNRLR